MKLSIAIIACVMAVSFQLFAATYYISPSGDDEGAGTSEGAAWKSFAYAFSAMTAGDELVLLDGTYSNATGTGYINYNDGSNPLCGQPPSGTNLSNVTYIHAKNAGQVTVDGGTRYGLWIGRSYRKDSYIKLEGIRFEGGGYFYNVSYSTVKNCSFHTAVANNGQAFGIGAGDTSDNTYNLVEDCWMWAANARGIVSNYRSDYNVWRRNVIRGDGGSEAYMTGSGNPNIGFTVYESSNVSVQNVIIVDRVLNGGTAYSDFATAMNTNGYNQSNNEWLGCISLNSVDMGYSFETAISGANTFKIENCIAWNDAVAGINSGGASTDAVIKNVTVGNCGNSGIRFWNSHGTVSGGAITNAIVYNAGTYGFTTLRTPTYCDVYGSGTAAYNNMGQSCTTGALTSCPTTYALLYLPRIEEGSELKGTGADGADYGANIVYRYGTDGARYGDSGYNTLSDVALWPWPNEAAIKADMAANGARGFCTGNSLDGTPQTLTKYVWEFIGNQIPDSVYGYKRLTISGGITITGSVTIGAN